MPGTMRRNFQQAAVDAVPVQIAVIPPYRIVSTCGG
jgi:hypothetical protein